MTDLVKTVVILALIVVVVLIATAGVVDCWSSSPADSVVGKIADCT